MRLVEDCHIKLLVHQLLFDLLLSYQVVGDDGYISLNPVAGGGDDLNGALYCTDTTMLPFPMGADDGGADDQYSFCLGAICGIPCCSGFAKTHFA